MEFLTPVLLIFAVLSMIIGCFGALVQTSLKRFVAYTSINQAGFVIAGGVIGTQHGIQASIVYLLTYMLTLFVFFFTLIEQKQRIESLNRFK